MTIPRPTPLPSTPFPSPQLISPLGLFFPPVLHPISSHPYPPIFLPNKVQISRNEPSVLLVDRAAFSTHPLPGLACISYVPQAEGPSCWFMNPASTPHCLPLALLYSPLRYSCFLTPLHGTFIVPKKPTSTVRMNTSMWGHGPHNRRMDASHLAASSSLISFAVCAPPSP